MTGVLILAHGSREGRTEETLRAIVGRVRSMLPEVPVEEAYLQFREKNLKAGLEALIVRGVDEIVVVPYFLFEGVHLKEDIPAELEAFREGHPAVRIRLGAPLGDDQRLADIVADRFREALSG